MFSPVSAITLITFAAASYAQSSIALDPAGQGLKITLPSSADWWVQQNQNVVAWTCLDTQIPLFTLLVLNSDPAILAAPEPFMANLKNTDCSETIQASDFTAAQGYQIALANPSNVTDIYAISEPFEIKPKGSAFATVTTTDIGASQTASSSGSSTASATSGGASSGTSSGAATKGTQVTSGLLGIAAGLLAFFT